MKVYGHRRGAGASGQVMVEYVVVAGMLVALVVMLSLLLVVFKEHGVRVLDLIASDYP